MKKPTLMQSAVAGHLQDWFILTQNGGNNNTLGREGVLRNSVAKGSIELKEHS